MKIRFCDVASLALAICFAQQIQSWMVPDRVPLPMWRQATKPLQSSPSASTPDISGKNIYKRVFYRLAPAFEVGSHDNIIVEERVRFLSDKTRGEGYLKPVGLRTLILRDGKVEEGEIGDEIFSINVKESMAEDSTHCGAGNDQAMEATIATILYLAANPKYVERDVLEVGCGLGLAGLLGCIGAGAIELGEAGSKNFNSDLSDAILTIPKGTPLTDELNQLMLSDTEQEKLNLALANLKHSNVPLTKISVEEMTWRTRPLGRRPPKVFHTIIASDLNYNTPEAKELARTVAHRLEALSSWEAKRDSRCPPTFIHVCPDAREEATYLHRFLSKGYRMNVKNSYFKLEKLLFKYQMLNELEPEKNLDDLELEVLDFKESVYQTLTAEHNPIYAQGGGEYFFPIETGEYDSLSGPTYFEPESDGSKWY